MRQLGELRYLLGRDEKHESTILAVALDNRPMLQRMMGWTAEEDGIRPDFTFLSDPGHLVANRYGLWNTNLAKDVGPEGPAMAHLKDAYTRSGEGYTNPATFVIDCHGVVQWRRIHSYDQRIRPTNRQVHSALSTLPKSCSNNSAQP